MTEQIGCSIAEATKLTGIGRTVLYQLMREGKVRYKKIGKRTIISVASLRELVES